MALDLADKKILVVDDQRPFQLMLKGILLSLGARSVVLVSSGEAAVSACKEVKFDIFFIDYNLGTVGKNGRQLLEEIQGRRLMKPESLFLIVTGESHRPMVLGALENQPDDYLMKPFSQVVLKKRLEKTYAKKIAFTAVFTAILNDQIPEAIKICRKLIHPRFRYKNYCTHLLIELLCKNQNYDEAEQLLNQVLEVKRQTWAVLQLAQVYYFQEKYKKTVFSINEVLIASPLLIDAYDTLAKAYFKMGQPKLAYDTAVKGSELSPYSIDRQFFLADIARSCAEYETVKNCTKMILDLSRRSYKQKPEYLLNYIRASVEAAEFAKDKKSSHKFQQEASLAIQRGRSDDALDSKFNYENFASLCNARIDAIAGQYYLAKKQLYEQIEKAGKIEDLTLQLVPDAYILLTQIGDYEQASQLVEPLKEITEKDPYIAGCISQRLEMTRDNRDLFSHYHSLGVKAYKAGEYSQSIEAFSEAIQQAPMHTGASINLIQSIIKQLDSLEDEKAKEYDYELCQLLHKTTRIVHGLSLPTEHQDRYQVLLPQIKKYSPKSVS
ncbi:hypothetical protein C2869_00235 [Saccharobesus litoralis]|uniref:Response regulatory domain-containing protein n=1 Tax=Saccharobesus litoralis TaxID=2172099 RepID=A0A2S0VL82_9ALTE|nr:tetratricopeptide repeat-containing response regulator [Saccharobesus litoralis]AWB64962.1 hypothetical protein C2869_00235 [Saccharobesus litoralis]